MLAKNLQAAAGNAGEPTDPQFSYVTMLLHGDGTNGASNGGAANPDIVPFNSDASANNFNVAINGDVKPNRFNPYQAGYYGNYFDGTGDYLSVPSSTGFELTGDFTIEMWIFKTKSTGAGQFDGLVYRSTDWRFKFQQSDNIINYDNGTDAQLINYTGSTPMLNNWHHLAFVRSGTTLTGYVDGVSYGSATVAGAFSASGAALIIADNPGSSAFGGYISNLRIVKGTAVYTSNFNPPTAPLTDITNTQLLTCQSNRFIDNSTNNFTITRTGDVAVSYFQPFTLPSSVEDYGAGYISGVNSVLTPPSNSALQMQTGDFTFECWLYYVTKTALQWIVDFGNSSTNGWSLYDDGSLQVRIGNVDRIMTSGLAVGRWYHIAVVRSGTTLTLYVNGVSVGSYGSASTDLTYSGAYALGNFAGLGYALNGYISNLRIVKGTAVYTSNFTPPSAPLTAITNTQLLTLQTNGGANDSGFIDSSPNDFLITRNGNTTQGSFSPYGDNWSNYFDGTGDYLSVSNATAFNLSTGDWTIECWINLSALVNERRIWSLGTYGANPEVALLIAGGGAGGSVNDLQINYLGNATLISATSVNAVGAWAHVAFVRASGTSTLYVNGVSKGTTATNPWTSSSTSFWIGGWSQNNNQVNGYISNMRVVKGTAVYTANFTPSTAPLTAIAGTSLLTCQSNRFKDASANNFTITVNGDTSVQRFSPFAPTAEYSASVIGGSGYFDGTGDWLQTPSNSAFNLSSGAYSLELFVFFNSVSGSSVNVLFGFSGAATTGYPHLLLSSNVLYWQTRGGGANETSVSWAPSAGQWYHIAVGWNGSNSLAIWINGTRVATNTVTPTSTGQNGLNIGGASDGYSINGYLSNARLVKGSDVYGVGNSTITVPTSPLTAITNTSLLLSMTNAGIYDNAMMADLETVGNAQVSTSVKKYGTGSMAFDGTGDYLKTPYTSLFSFGTGDFTVECWANISSVQYTAIISSTSTSISTSMWLLGFSNTTNQMTFGIDSGGGAICGADYTSYLNTWTHIAASRSGSTLKLFFNGVQVNSVSNSTSFTGDTANPIVLGRRYTNSDQYHLNGYIDDLRITKGYARYTANFTPPTAAFPNQ